MGRTGPYTTESTVYYSYDSKEKKVNLVSCSHMHMTYCISVHLCVKSMSSYDVKCFQLLLNVLILPLQSCKNVVSASAALH